MANRVQFTSSLSAGSSTAIAATLSNVTEGNLLVAIVMNDQATPPTISSVNDDLSTVGELAAASTYDLQQRLEIWFIENATAGQRTVTATFASATTNRGIVLIEVEGIAASPLVGGTNDDTNDSANPSTPAVTAVGENCYCVGGLFDFADPTVGGAFNEVFEGDPGGGTFFAIEDQTKATAGSIAAAWTAANSSWCAAFAVFKSLVSAAITGTATATIDEADVVAGGKTIIATLTNDTFVASSAVTAITQPASALGSTTTTTSFSIVLPTTAANDILLLEFCHRGTSNGTIAGTSVTTGGLTWTHKHGQNFATNASSGHLYWTRATGDHATQTVTGAGLSNSCAAIVKVKRGCVTSGDPFDGAATIVGEANASANETQAEITTLVDGAEVNLTVLNTPDLAVSAHSCGIGALGSEIERLSTGGLDSSVSSACAVKASAGATGAFVWAQTDSANGSYAYALEPAVTTPFADARQAIIDGLDSAQAEGTGWNAEVRDNLAVTTVVRTSNTIVTITLSAQAAYAITAQETITVTLPAVALSGAGAIVGTPTFTVDTDGGAPASSILLQLLLHG